jgi:hypothetical protein
MDPQHGHGTVLDDLSTEASRVLPDLRLEPLGLARIDVKAINAWCVMSSPSIVPAARRR